MAWRGSGGETRAEAAVVAETARTQGEGWKLAWVEYALCVFELSLGRYQEAAASTPSAFEDNLLVSAFALPDFIEAAVRSGADAAAREALARIANRAPPAARRWRVGCSPAPAPCSPMARKPRRSIRKPSAG
jgi:hypothetical protein